MTTESPGNGSSVVVWYYRARVTHDNGLRTMFAEGGVASLYAGLPATLLIGIPSNVLYFACYEALRDWMRSRFSRAESMAPMVAGAVSRTVAVTACSPLEVLRTRIQSKRLVRDPGSGSVRLLQDMVRKEGLAVLTRGLASTVWRDAPFSAVFWLGTESLRNALLLRGFCQDSVLQVPLVSFVASVSAGGVAALLTAPFDVAKTRAQVGLSSSGARGMRQTFATVVRQEGLRGLWTGAAPRVARVAPACGIMLGTYELMKHAVRL